MEEVWKPVEGYEEFYQVSNMGRVRSIDRIVAKGWRPYLKHGRVLAPQARQHGYLSVWLYTGDAKKQVSVHRLVAEAFCERKEGQDEVNHLNENKQDNRAENLAWCTRSENCSYGEKLAESRKKWRNRADRSKAVRQYTLSGEFVKEYPSLHEVRRQTGFGEGNICHAINGKYTHAYGYVWKYAS